MIETVICILAALCFFKHAPNLNNMIDTNKTCRIPTLVGSDAVMIK